ncbi:hypothetical protein GGI35DRAFT_463092 [Trichoderma velutinum]
MVTVPRLSLRPKDDIDQLVMLDIEAETPQAFNTVIREDFDGAALLKELAVHISDLLAISSRFGRKLSTSINNAALQNVIFPDHAKLQLACLNQFDLFSNIQIISRDKPTEFRTPKPILYWIYSVVLRLGSDDYCYSAILKLKPSHDCAVKFSVPPIDIALRKEDGKLTTVLTIYHGGEGNRREVFDESVPREQQSSERPKWGKALPLQDRADRADNVDASSVPIGIDSVFNFLFPRQNNRWLLATTAFVKEHKAWNGWMNDEFLLSRLVQGFKAPDDRLYVSDEQDRKCQALFLRFPLDAQKALLEEIGKPGGPYSFTASAPDLRD